MFIFSMLVLFLGQFFTKCCVLTFVSIMLTFYCIMVCSKLIYFTVSTFNSIEIEIIDCVLLVRFATILVVFVNLVLLCSQCNLRNLRLYSRRLLQRWQNFFV